VNSVTLSDTKILKPPENGGSAVKGITSAKADPKYYPTPHLGTPSVSNNSNMSLLHSLGSGNPADLNSANRVQLLPR
jgi:hypothetical protein